MQFTGTTVIKVLDGMIGEGIGLDDGVTVLQQPSPRVAAGTARPALVARVFRLMTSDPDA